MLELRLSCDGEHVITQGRRGGARNHIRDRLVIGRGTHADAPPTVAVIRERPV